MTHSTQSVDTYLLYSPPVPQAHGNTLENETRLKVYAPCRARAPV